MDAGGGRDQEQNLSYAAGYQEAGDPPRGHFPTGLGRDAARPAPGQPMSYRTEAAVHCRRRMSAM